MILQSPVDVGFMSHRIEVEAELDHGFFSIEKSGEGLTVPVLRQGEDREEDRRARGGDRSGREFGSGLQRIFGESQRSRTTGLERGRLDDGARRAGGLRGLPWSGSRRRAGRRGRWRVEIVRGIDLSHEIEAFGISTRSTSVIPGRWIEKTIGPRLTSDPLF